MKLRKLFSGSASLFLLLVILGTLSCRQATEAVDAATESAPNFTLKDLNGNTFQLSDVKGKVVILDFWATWCPPCRMEIPHFEELHQEYKSKGLAVIGIALDRGGASQVKPFVEINRVSYLVLMGDGIVTEAYGGIRGIPTTFVIDRDGNIREKFVGYRSKEVFEETIKKLL